MTAVEKFAQLIPLNIQEIFTWYFEQKGVDNPERFLMQQLPSAPLEGEVSVGQRGVNEVNKVVNNNQPESLLPAESEGDSASINQLKPEQQGQAQEQGQQNSVSPDILMQLIRILVPLMQSKLGNKSSDFGDFIQKIEEQILNKEKINEV